MTQIPCMKTRNSLVILFFLSFTVVVTGCGKDLFTAATPPPPSTLGTGNWFITGFYPSGTEVASFSFGGSLINSGGQISGVFHISQSCFGNGSTDVPYIGTLDDKNTLSITSSSVNGETLAFLGTLSSDGSSISDGTITVRGSCTGAIMITPGSGEEIEAIRVPSLTGSWGPGSHTYLVGFSEQLTQASTPDLHGDYALTGTVTVTGSACFTQGTLQDGSFVSGGLGRQIIRMNDGSTVEAAMNLYSNGPTSGRPMLLLTSGTISGGNCNGTIEVGLE